MKMIIGIDVAGHWEAPVSLIRRIRFTDPVPYLVHALEPVPVMGIYPMAGDPNAMATIERELQECGEKTLAEAHSTLGIRCEEIVRPGSPVSVLMAEADERGADLIAVGSEQKGKWGSLFFGSVGKGLLMGADHSILFGKGEVAQEGPVTAVFATDHSEYAQRAVDWLLSHLPAGLGQLIILTAVSEGDDRGQFEKANHDLAIRFSQQGIAARGEVIEGHPSQAIKDAMAAHKADLLIVGAQGHGFLERLRIGSLSFEVVVNSPYSVLVVRP